MTHFNLKKALLNSVMGAAVLTGSVMMANAQNVNSEYRQWQRAEAQAQREYRDYLNSRSQRDYNQWQMAARRAQVEKLQYERSIGRNGYSYGYNNGYANTNRGMYRIYRNGSYYSTDSRGAELLRQAVNNGYAQGYRQGQVARRYGRNYDYDNESLYRSGTYGYQSYVDRNQYQYYFQQGFQRGFEDGYYSRTRYGYSTNNGMSILGGVLNTILNIAQQ